MTNLFAYRNQRPPSMEEEVMTPFGRELEESMKPLDAMMSDLLVKRMTQATRPLSKRKWLVLDFDDQPFGPFFLADVMQFIGSRAITKDSQIYDEEEGKWNFASYTFEQISQLMSFDNYQLERNDASIQRIDRVRVPDVRCAKDVIWSNIQDLEVSTDVSSYVLHQGNLVRNLDPQFFDLSLDSIGENDVMKLESVLEFDDIGLEVLETKEESRVELDICGIDMAFETLSVIDAIGMPKLDDEEYSSEKMQVHGVKVGEDVTLNDAVLMGLSSIEFYGICSENGSRTILKARSTCVEYFKWCVGYSNVEKFRLKGICIWLDETSLCKLVVGGNFWKVVFSIFKVDQKMLDDKEWNFKKRKKILESLGPLLVLLEEKDGFREQKDAVLKLDRSCDIDECWVYVMELVPIQCFAKLSTLLQFQPSNGASKIRRNFKKRKKKLQSVKGPWGQGQFGGNGVVCSNGVQANVCYAGHVWPCGVMVLWWLENWKISSITSCSITATVAWNFKRRKKKLQFVRIVLGGKDNLVRMVQSSSKNRILQPPIHEGTGFGRTHWIRKQLADRNRIEKKFREGNWVFLKLHLFGQYTLLQQQSHKMFPKYCESFQIIMRVGGVAYELNLPSSARIHNVIHVSVLKKCWASASSNPRVTSETPNCLQQEEAHSYPEKFVKNGNTSRTMWLTQWRGQSATDATWECVEEMLIRFPDFAFNS